MLEPAHTYQTRRWDELNPETQTELRIAYGYDTDHLPNSCSINVKTDHFAGWLAERGVNYDKQQEESPREETLEERFERWRRGD